jgi:polyisoprenoid-binding protein YceI
MKHFLIFAALTLLAMPALAALTRTGDDASASFVAVGPAGLTIEGKTNEVILTERDGMLVFTVPLSGIDTGISLRNKHMREKYLEVHRHPNAVFTVSRAQLDLPSAGRTRSGTITGALSIHGVTKAVSAKYKVRNDNGRLDTEGSMRINIRDFGINVPSYLGVTVKPDVDVAIKLSAAEK